MTLFLAGLGIGHHIAIDYTRTELSDIRYTMKTLLQYSPKVQRIIELAHQRAAREDSLGKEWDKKWQKMLKRVNRNP